MKFRALIFEDDNAIRSYLRQLFDDFGYEVFTFQDPSICPLNEKHDCDCPVEHACADVIISDNNMQKVDGLDFIKGLKQKGCKVDHIAIMSGDWTPEAIDEAEKLGCKILAKPFRMEAVADWLKKCEKKIKHGRKLSTSIGFVQEKP